jgi:hypothetical protein
MTYVSGQLIQAADYNGFVNDTAGANINATWSTGTTDSGYGQSALTTVSALGTVTATQWASLVNTVSSMASHQGTTITSRVAPTTGATISILAAVNTDITNCRTNRGNAVATGSQFTGWSGTNSKTTTTSGATWTITFTNTMTFASADAARYFWNAGGLVRLVTSKTATGNTGDPEWNDLATTLCGGIWISGRVNSTSQTIAGQIYTGTTKIGGTGTPTILTTTTGWYQLTALPTIIYKQFADTAPYTSNFIQHTATATATTLTIVTTWSASDGDPITGGTASSGATPGTAPTTIMTYYPPSTTYLTQTWGAPTVVASVV